MKVLCFLPFNSCGSLQKRALTVAIHLRSYDIDTVFVLPKNPSGLVDCVSVLKKHKFKVYEANILRPVAARSFSGFLHNLRYILHFPRHLLACYRVIRKEKPDLILIIGLISIQEAIVASMRFRKKFMWNLIGSMYPSFLVACLRPLILKAERRIFIANSLQRMI